MTDLCDALRVFQERGKEQAWGSPAQRRPVTQGEGARLDERGENPERGPYAGQSPSGVGNRPSPRAGPLASVLRGFLQDFKRT